MKTSALKKILKEAVREVIQEELKDILLEAVKAPQIVTPQSISQPVNENQQFTPPTSQIKSGLSEQEKRDAYKNILGEMGGPPTLNSSNAQSFRPNPAMDATNGSLPAGDVDMSQIMGLMNKK